MFRNVLDYGYKRTTLQAVGFYIAHLVILILISGIAGGIYGVITETPRDVEQAYGAIVRVGHAAGVLMCLVVSFAIIRKKKMTNNIGYVFLALSSGLFALLLGGILGLIPPAILTTRDSGAVPEGGDTPARSDA
jgi:hypothetical protein